MRRFEEPFAAAPLGLPRLQSVTHVVDKLTQFDPLRFEAADRQVLHQFWRAIGVRIVCRPVQGQGGRICARELT